MKKIQPVALLIINLIVVGSSFGQFSIPQMTHRLLLADEGNGKVHYINLNNTTEKWSVTCSNRDLQIIGNNRVMVSDNGGTGYTEINITTGATIGHVTVAGSGSGINSAFRLSASETFCARDGSPAKIIKVDATGKILNSITLSLDASVRICRPTPAGTFIIGGKTAGMMCEFDSTGKKIWEVNAGGEPYMALRLPNGTTLLSTGYSAQMVLADKQGNVLKKFPTDLDKKSDSAFWKAAIPNFFAGFQILRNGNIVVSNWQGHGTGHGNSGFQLLEFNSALTKVIAYWKQNGTLVSSLHGVLVLDSLNTELLHSDYNGILQPIGDQVTTQDHDEVPSPYETCYFTNKITLFDVMGRLLATDQRSTSLIPNNTGSARMMRYLSSGTYVANITMHSATISTKFTISQ